MAWWLWAGGMAVAASKTTNPVLLLLIAAVCAFVVVARRTSAPWARSLGFFVRLGLVVIAVRVVIEIVFGQRGVPGHVMFTIPAIHLPSWAEGVSIGGPVTLESILVAVTQGMRLAAILVCFGAANSLASPYRLLRCLPAIVYEAGVAVTVALAFAPELVLSIAGVREARRLRGRPVRGPRGLRGMAVPVLEGSLDRSLQLAASMDARGYGRRQTLGRGVRRAATVGLFVGLLAVTAGVYGVVDPGSTFGLGLPVLALGAVAVAGSLVAGGRRTARTRYRPDRWGWREWVVTASGAVALAAVAVAEATGSAGVQVAFTPLEVPALPLLAVAGILVGLVPATVAPAPARGRPSARPGPPTPVSATAPQGTPLADADVAERSR
ncbi:MAG: energy-coupling factor transporter transmembrane component T [Acidimicrobiales bacterium]